MYLFLWDFSQTREFWQGVSFTISILVYIWLIALDYKYKEMEFWKLLVGIGVNSVAIIANVLIFGCPCFKIYMLIPIPVFLILTFINTKFNKENIIGQADIDIIAGQIGFTIAYIIFVFNNKESDVALLNIYNYLQLMFASLFIGGILVIVVGLLRMLFIKIKTKDKFSDIFKNNRHVPALLAFIPVIMTNMYVLMSTGG